ncbi:LINE-1 type transposase domain-containing protein 1 [Saccopteryx leptura]|uniref:LINE-1 type transposase domain-containing protein 1 n=1 Tax=Saccopteryx leptura TaxID=249018 RepID=UPI00339BEBB4
MRKNLKSTDMERSPARQMSEPEEDRLTQLQKLVMTRFNELNENISGIRQDMNKNQEEMKNAITELKNTVESFKSRLEEAEDRISELEDKLVKMEQKEKQYEKRILKSEDKLREIQDNMKRNNICIIGISEGEENEQGIEKVFENIMTENFPSMVKGKPIQVQEAQRVPNKVNPRRPTPRHIIIKTAKFTDKDKILKAAREKQKITYKGSPIRLSTDFSTETLQARREWQDIFQLMKSKGLQPRLLYPARLSIKIEGEIRNFSDKGSLKQFASTKPALQEIIKGLL